MPRYIIEEATEDHFVFLAVHLATWIKLFPAYADDEVDTDHTIDQLYRMAPILHGRVLLDTHNEDEVVGILAYTITPSLWSTRVEAAELFFVIKPEARGIYNAVALIKDAERDAWAKGATRFYMGNSSGFDDEAIAKLYTRLGFMPHSGNFIKSKEV